MNKNIFPAVFILIMILFTNQNSFCQKNGYARDTVLSADSSDVRSFLNNKSDSLTKWKMSREFLYMNYLDSLLRKQKSVKSDTVRINENSGEIKKSQERSNPVAIRFLNSFPVKIFFWLIAVFFIVFIIYKVVFKNKMFSINGEKSNKETDDDSLKLNEPSEYDIHISTAETNKDFNLAVRYLYLKTIAILSERELIQFSADKTNREYLSEMESGLLAKDFGLLTHDYEYIWYGKFVIDLHHYDLVKDQFIQFIKKVQSI
jgi:cell division protein FtsL